jgi:PAS domain S-box-containing protein
MDTTPGQTQTDYFQDLRFLQSIIDVIDEGVVVQSNQGRIVGFNERACKILSLAPEQLLGKTSYDADWEVFFPDGRKAPGEEHPASITLRTGEAQYNVIMGMKTGNQQIRWLSVNTRMVNLLDDAFVFATFSDVTDLFLNNLSLKEQQQRIRNSEEKFAKSFRHSGIGKAIVSPDGRLMEVNDAFSKMLGYSREEMQYLRFHDITHPDDLASDVELVEKMLNREIESYNLEKRYIHKNGQVIWALLTVALVWDVHDNPQFFISQIQEITEVKKLNAWLSERNTELLNTQAALTRKINQLKDFAGIITHDVRGPAANIRKMLDLYETAEDEETRATAYSFLKKTSNNLVNNLNELIQVLQLHLEEDVPRSECDFKEILASITNQFGEALLEKNAHIHSEFEVPSILYPKVYLQSILYNLISNSLKYSKPGEPCEIHIKTWQENGSTFLRITDNGLGFDLEQHKNAIFKFRKSFHAGYDSKGIGLYLVRNQVEDLGGSISVESEPEKGSSFTICF